MNRYPLFVVVAVMVGLASCGRGVKKDSSSSSETTDAPEAAATATAGMSQNIIEYGQECADAIAPIEPFDCRGGTEAVITVNGDTVTDHWRGMECDRPALLPYGDASDGQCVPFSYAHVLGDDEEVQISAFCRTKYIRAGSANVYDEIDIIAHDRQTGGTCWFSAKSDSANPLDGSRVPPPNEIQPPPGRPAAIDFWDPPDSTAKEVCAGCHDNDPFYYSPYIAQTGQLPADPWGRYNSDIGEAFSDWPEPMSLEIRGNTCTGCHRIGATFTCGTGAIQSIGGESPGRDDWAKQWPQSHWMPEGNQWSPEQWAVIYSESFAQLQQCCNQDSLPDFCVFKPIAGATPAPSNVPYPVGDRKKR